MTFNLIHLEASINLLIQNIFFSHLILAIFSSQSMTISVAMKERFVVLFFGPAARDCTVINIGTNAGKSVSK